ncbi:MAG: cysteine desulfurase [Verrucomicrobia bacterium]|nr:cysteine desulfurase [Verrucomicrobiota bacterium]NBU09514.1 cysteine desulfurase [Pseudomonadota bacterium]NDA65527.1 cysteine desulfurase [Verrucomicrobiota bacterium]NDB74397.1 cysteine desulfurase [Verrucomicrobiota bacterium]NDD37244.1 cysteine desulfurase [Verrucomicrobiota bacterium]
MPSSSPDWSALRADFPILDQQVHGHPLVYFDNAATSQKPRAVVDALVRYYERDNANVHRGIHELSNRSTNAFEAARERTRKFLNACSTEEIIFTRGTTEGINLIANAWGGKFIKAGDVILLTEMEHHSNIVPWQMLAERTGAKLRYVPITGDEGLLDLDKLDSLLTPEVKLFAMVHISNALGTLNPVADLCARARRLGITTLVDGAQSAGHMMVDVQAIGCDFYAFSGHKICGPTGIGALYGRKEVLENTPPWHGGGEMIATVDYFKSTWNTLPHKFEAGTPDISGPIGLHAALDYLDAIGRENIFRHDLEMASYAYQRLSELKGVRLFGPKGERGGLVSFLLDDVHAHDVVTIADRYGVALRGGHHCTQPLMKKLGVPSTARASFYFYNTKAEVDRFIEVVREIQKFFGT